MAKPDLPELIQALITLDTLDAQIDAMAEKNPARAGLTEIIIRLALAILRAITALVEAFKPNTSD